MPKLVEIENPDLDNIPEMLRLMASRIERKTLQTEKGEKFEPLGAIVVLVRDNGYWPEVWGFGDVGSEIVELEAAKQKLFYMAFPPERLDK